jgi:hypothetical protein
MKKLFFILIVFFYFTGCALPTVGEDLNDFVGAQFTNKKYRDRNPKNMRRYVWSLGNYEDLYYKKEPEGMNTRYYIDWGVKDCRYSLLVSPDDIILSWRDEGGETHVSKCTYS